MGEKKVLCIRSAQSALNFNTYNIQPIGMGKAFVRCGYDFDFITFNKNSQSEFVFFEENGHKARVIEKPRKRIFSWGINTQIADKDFLEQYDIVILLEYYQIMTYIISSRTDRALLYSGPYKSLFMIPFMSSLYDFLFTKIINKNIKHKFVKSDLAKEYLEKKGYTNVKTLGVALETERFKENVEIQKNIKELVEYMTKNECILYIGRIDENKNTPFLLDVFSELLKLKPELKLVIIGKSAVPLSKRILGKTNDSYAFELFKKYPKNVTDKLFYIKCVENAQLKYIYPLAKAFLLPSKNEIFGMVMLEAMYLGAPVVTSRNGGSCTLIKDEFYGQVIPEFKIELWVKAVMRFLEDSEYSKVVKEKAHELVENKFNWNELVSIILKDINDSQSNENFY